MSDIITPTRGHLLATFPVFCQVKPLARPRARKYFSSVYQPVGNQKELRDSLSAYEALNINEPVIIDIYINLKKAKSSKLAYPTGKNHGDEDNMRKAVLDGLVNVEILSDDSLVLGGETFKYFGQEDVALINIFSVNPNVIGSIDVLSQTISG